MLERIVEYQGRLDHIEAAINKLRVPLTLFGEVNRLKEQVDLVRGKFDRMRLNSERKNP